MADNPGDIPGYGAIPGPLADLPPEATNPWPPGYDQANPHGRIERRSLGPN